MRLRTAGFQALEFAQLFHDQLPGVLSNRGWPNERCCCVAYVVGKIQPEGFYIVKVVCHVRCGKRYRG